MAVEMTLLNYGVLGLWTASLLYERKFMLSKMLEILNEIKLHVKRGK